MKFVRDDRNYFDLTNKQIDERTDNTIPIQNLKKTFKSFKEFLSKINFENKYDIILNNSIIIRI